MHQLIILFLCIKTTTMNNIGFIFVPLSRQQNKHLKSTDARAANTAMVPFGLYADSVPFLAGKNEVPVPRATRIQRQSHLSCNI